MRDILNRLLKNKGLERWFRRDNLIILILSGVLLFIIALPTKDSGGRNENTAENRAQTESMGNIPAEGETNLRTSAPEGEASNTNVSEEDYCAYMERKLTEIVSGMDGVGSVNVMITLKSSRELVVEKDKPVTRSSTNEQDSQGGSRLINQADTSETTVYRSQGGDSEPYVVKTMLPQVEGVVVVAEGAGKGTINKNITEIVQALFDVEAHKIKVVKMESGN